MEKSDIRELTKSLREIRYELKRIADAMENKNRDFVVRNGEWTITTTQDTEITVDMDDGK